MSFDRGRWFNALWSRLFTNLGWTSPNVGTSSNVVTRTTISRSRNVWSDGLWMDALERFVQTIWSSLAVDGYGFRQTINAVWFKLESLIFLLHYRFPRFYLWLNFVQICQPFLAIAFFLFIIRLFRIILGLWRFSSDLVVFVSPLLLQQLMSWMDYTGDVTLTTGYDVWWCLYPLFLFITDVLDGLLMGDVALNTGYDVWWCLYFLFFFNNWCSGWTPQGTWPSPLGTTHPFSWIYYSKTLPISITSFPLHNHCSLFSPSSSPIFSLLYASMLLVSAVTAVLISTQYSLAMGRLQMRVRASIATEVNLSVIKRQKSWIWGYR